MELTDAEKAESHDRKLLTTPRYGMRPTSRLRKTKREYEEEQAREHVGVPPFEQRRQTSSPDAAASRVGKRIYGYCYHFPCSRTVAWCNPCRLAEPTAICLPGPGRISLERVGATETRREHDRRGTRSAFGEQAEARGKLYGTTSRTSARPATAGGSPCLANLRSLSGSGKIPTSLFAMSDAC